MEHVCVLHNDVSKRLGKPEMPCEVVYKVWGQKDCGCDPQAILRKAQKADELKKRRAALDVGKSKKKVDRKAKDSDETSGKPDVTPTEDGKGGVAAEEPKQL
jgi:hypothetical protein